METTLPAWSVAERQGGHEVVRHRGGEHNSCLPPFSLSLLSSLSTLLSSLVEGEKGAGKSGWSVSRQICHGLSLSLSLSHPLTLSLWSVNKRLLSHPLTLSLWSVNKRLWVLVNKRLWVLGLYGLSTNDYGFLGSLSFSRVHTRLTIGSLSLFLTLSLSLAVALSRSLALSLAFSLFVSSHRCTDDVFSVSGSLSLSHSLSRTDILILSLCHSLWLSRSLALSLSRSLALALSLFLSTIRVVRRCLGR